MPQGEDEYVRQREERRLQAARKEATERAAYNARVAGAQQLYADTAAQNKDAIRQLHEDRKADIATAKQTALQEYMTKNAQMREQSDRRLSAPPTAPNPVGSIAPLEQITGVALNDALAGNNVATEAFFVRPENSVGRGNIGAPVGGGNIGSRQRNDTANLSARTDSLGAKSKDQF